jgi:hypothetical protein
MGWLSRDELAWNRNTTTILNCLAKTPTVSCAEYTKTVAASRRNGVLDGREIGRFRK